MMVYLQFMIVCLLDMVIGDPERLPHPVQGIGWMCTTFEERSRKVFVRPANAGLAATFMVCSVTVLAVGMGFMLLHVLSPLVESVVAIWVLVTSLACRSLYDHSMRVYRQLANGSSLEEVRREVGRIVGRDTSQLDRQGVTRACIETVAENMVDGVAAPLFWAVLFSMLPDGGVLAPISLAAVGAYFYKSVNTMDSMYGYKNEKYLEFGRYAARLDDLLTFIPARLSGALLAGCGLFFGMDWRRGWRIFLRDRLNHASPNSAHAEAAVAGLLGIRLGGPASYFGIVVDKPTIGDGLRDCDQEDIIAANRLMFLASGMFLGVTLLVRYLVLGG